MNSRKNLFFFVFLSLIISFSYSYIFTLPGEPRVGSCHSENVQGKFKVGGTFEYCREGLRGCSCGDVTLVVVLLNSSARKFIWPISYTHPNYNAVLNAMVSSAGRLLDPYLVNLALNEAHRRGFFAQELEQLEKEKVREQIIKEDIEIYRELTDEYRKRRKELSEIAAKNDKEIKEIQERILDLEKEHLKQVREIEEQVEKDAQELAAEKVRFEKELEEDSRRSKIEKAKRDKEEQKEKKLQNAIKEQREKEAQEKLETEKRLTRQEDEEFNGGRERIAEIDNYIKKLKEEGNEKAAQTMEEFLKNPYKVAMSDEALDYFGSKARKFDYQSRDVVDNAIINSINTSTDLLKGLEAPCLFHNEFIIERLKESLVAGDTSLVHQAHFLSSQNNVEGALNTTSLINSITNLAQGFATGYYERVDGIGGTLGTIGAAIVDTAVTLATNPQEILEKVGCMMMEAVSPATLDVMAAISPRIAERREELQDTVGSLMRSIGETVQSASAFAGKVQNNIVEFAKEYGPAFNTPNDYLGLPEQVCKTMMAEQQVAQQKLREAVSAYAAGVTAKGVGEVIGSVAADCATTYFGGKIAGKIGEAVSSSTKGEAVCAAAREIEAAALPAVTPAVQELPVATQALQEASGAQQVLEEIYKYNHGGLTPHEFQHAIQQRAASPVASALEEPAAVTTPNKAAVSLQTVTKEVESLSAAAATTDTAFVETTSARLAEEVALAEAEALEAYSSYSQSERIDNRLWITVSDTPLVEEKIAASKAQSVSKRNSYVCKESQERVFLLEQCSTEIATECKELYSMLPSHLQNKSVIDRYIRLKQKFPDITPKGYNHIFHGEFHKEGANWLLKGGMHTEESLQKFLKANNTFLKNQAIETIECTNGVRVALLPEELFFDSKTFRSSVTIIDGKRYQGVKTLWPKYYTPEMILEEIKNITTNSHNLIKPGEFVGMTKGHFKIKVVMNSANKPVTAYPLIN